MQSSHLFVEAALIEPAIGAAGLNTLIALLLYLGISPLRHDATSHAARAGGTHSTRTLAEWH